jgi:cobaltochelatase CobS
MSTITCQICGKGINVVKTHLEKDHNDWTLELYKEEWPLAPLLSKQAEEILEKKRREREGSSAPAVVSAPVADPAAEQSFGFMHEVFEFGNVPAAMNDRGQPIKIRLFKSDRSDLVPDKDPNYIFDINLTKTILMGLELNIPSYLWGHAGVGKTTALEQVCAYTGRPFIRIQHTANTEESDIEGGYRVTNGDMAWFDGPLPEAMENGWVFCADEYDFASPMVASLYQAVLEGKSLRIKAANKVVRPHKEFRIVATGNTNGAGDETGLYAGTQIQNAANYERFGIVMKVNYMPENQEIGIIMGKTSVNEEMAKKLVNYANTMRASFERRDVAIPISPRALLNATKLGLARNSWDYGFHCAYINRLPPTSAKVAADTMQRILG